MNECTRNLLCIEHLIHVEEFPSLYNYDYAIMKINVNTNIELGCKLKKSKNPDAMFNNTFEKNQSIKIFTDGSKNDGGISVGSACVCPELNVIRNKSIINRASIFTAECIALSDAMDVAL